ncbi:PadR family transcriptional regulator [Prauserella sp. PE36]|uniref:PadR family transcriptional regulator n=1 Tax=Prauserella endophytica TaxID=1592324 RepID=A0ABY2S440_9PSEU|nr:MULTISPECIES: PadR family transcriptional regulator [Prauserella]PXY25098.1 PadR family transcriptional regulator [Prauserella coralliicola]RBM23489.1 PadR family transcriptional regulator [Prauserella sp. PE36]TKG69179.1 PadR family transcriptional regulator [Prauserella endophytica]
MAGRTRANPLALAVLCLLYERPMHPYEMSSTLRERHKEDSIKLNYGSLYSVVESLRKRGLITARETVREGRRPERTVYAITEAGSTEMTDWLSDLLSRPAKEFTQFEAALSLMPIFGPDEVINLLETRLRSLRQQQRAHDQSNAWAPPNFPRLFLIEMEFKYALLRTEIEFVSALLDELRSGTFEGIALWRRMHELREEGRTPEAVDEVLAEEFKEELSWLSELSDTQRPEQG